ncbi:MAG: hypothetical protein HY300_14425 [Verrucomicrobia bacterium]|nr:hypothetical protein [Verrucomicrobiota bacterium]
MKTLKYLAAILVLAGSVATVALVRADDPKATKPKPYPLNICVVSGEKLGEHGKPYVFVHEGPETKMCCDDCLKDFNKDTAKYMKKIADAQKKKDEKK